MIYLSLILCLFLSMPVYAADSRPISPLVGVCTHFLRYPRNYQVSRMLKVLGVKYVRDDLTWQGVERVKGKFNLNPRMANYIDELNAIGIKPIIVLAYSNPIYTKEKSDKTGIDTDKMRKAFGDYAAFMVSKLKGRVYAWEIWNEPDHSGFWQPVPNSQDYSLLVKYVAPLIRRIDPHALIIAGALSNPAGDGKEYLSSLQKETALTDVDVISFHWYTYPKPPESEGIHRMANLRSFVQEIKRLGKRAWLTEMGYPTSTDKSGVSEAQQAEYTKKQLELAANMGVEVCVIYDLIDDGPNAANRDNRHGLFRQDGSPKPAATMLTTFNAR